MNKLVFIALVGFGAWAHLTKYSFLPKEGFDKDGNPVVRVFVPNLCGKFCDDTTSMITKRGVAVEQVDITTRGMQDFVIMIGAKRISYRTEPDIVSALAEAYGEKALTLPERRAMSGHFESNGRPKVVLYGTHWCGACTSQKKYLTQNGIEFEYVDVEASADGGLAFTTLKGHAYPTVYVGYRHFSGYTEGSLKDAVAELKGGSGVNPVAAEPIDGFR